MSKKSSDNFLQKHQHNLIPSSVGGLVAYFFSGVVLLGVLVFAAVWIGNMVSHKSRKH